MATHSSILAWRAMDREAWQAIVQGFAKSRTRQHSTHSSVPQAQYRKLCWPHLGAPAEYHERGKAMVIQDREGRHGPWHGDPSRVLRLQWDFLPYFAHSVLSSPLALFLLVLLPGPSKSSSLSFLPTKVSPDLPVPTFQMLTTPSTTPSHRLPAISFLFPVSSTHFFNCRPVFGLFQALKWEFFEGRHWEQHSCMTLAPSPGLGTQVVFSDCALNWIDLWRFLNGLDLQAGPVHFTMLCMMTEHREEQ